MTNKRMKVVMTDYDYPSLNLERKVLEEIDADFVGAHDGCQRCRWYPQSICSHNRGDEARFWERRI